MNSKGHNIFWIIASVLATAYMVYVLIVSLAISEEMDAARAALWCFSVGLLLFILLRTLGMGGNIYKGERIELALLAIFDATLWFLGLRPVVAVIFAVELVLYLVSLVYFQIRSEKGSG